MIERAPDFGISKSRKVPRKTTLRLHLVDPMDNRIASGKGNSEALSDFSFSTPPWLLPNAQGFLDDNGAISIAKLPQLIALRINDGRHVRRLSEKSISSYEETTPYWVWFVENRGSGKCSEIELYEFFEYCREKHNSGNGRWRIEGNTQPLSPHSQNLHYCNLRAIIRWAKRNKHISENPIERIPVPKFKPASIKPFSEEEVGRLLLAAKNSDMPLRNVAVLLFMWGTGVRESELCDLKIKDLN